MDKLAAGPAVKDVVDIRKSVAENIQAVANKLHSGEWFVLYILEASYIDSLPNDCTAVSGRLIH
jgi:fructose-1,6-bisphosphatase/sedoheptulose 1,7-bisphosphatase-like protein